MKLKSAFLLFYAAAWCDIGLSQVIQAPAATVKLPDIKVTGASLVSPTDDFVMRSPRSIQETPRSLTVVDSEAIRQRNMRTTNDAYESAPGFFANSRTNEGYHFIARGFRMSQGNILVDGFAGLLAGGGQKAPPLYGFESVTLLGGPANLVYGQSNLPGGMVNLTTKKAGATASSSLTLSGQTYAGQGLNLMSRHGAAIELDHAGLAGDTPYRIGVAADDIDGQVAGTFDRTRYYGASAKLPIGAGKLISITPLAHRWESVTPSGAGMTASAGSSLSTNDGRTSVNTRDLSPLSVNLYGGGRTDNITMAGFDLQAGGADAIKVGANYRFIHFDTDRNEWTPKTLSSSGIMTRQQTKTQSEADSHNLDVFLTFENGAGKETRNRVVTGLRVARTDARNRSADGPLTSGQSPIDIRTGALSSGGLSDLSTGWKPYVVTASTQWNSYVQDQAYLMGGKLVLTGGLGYGALSKDGYGTSRSDLTPNIAAMWNFNPRFGAYLSYDQSFQYVDPAIAYEDAAGRALTPAPTTGDSREIGLKFESADRLARLNTALFSARRQNVLEQSATGVTNPNGNRYYSTIPGQESHGLELSGALQAAKDWSLEASFAWIRGSYNQTPLGGMLAKTPEFSVNLTSRWEHGPVFGHGNLSSYAGATWQDERLSGNGARTTAAPDPIMLPAFVRFDVGADYALSRAFRISVHVRNLLDRRIFIDGTTGANLQLDAPRTITVKATYAY